MNTDSAKLWEEEVRDYVEKTYRKVVSDPILTETLEGLLNHVDSDIMTNQGFGFRIEPLSKVLSSNHYYTRFHSVEESDIVKELSEKVNTLLKLCKYDERRAKPKEVKVEEKKRLPNTPGDVRKMYGE